MIERYKTWRRVAVLFLRYSGWAKFFRIFRMLLDDVEKERLLTSPNIHNSVILNGSDIIVTRPNNIQIGENSGLHGEAYLETRGGLVIGCNVHIAKGFTVFTTNHNYRSDQSIPYDEKVLSEPVTIEDFVWIGANVSIIPGITIHEGAIVGMGAVVAKDVPACAIVGGSPAKILGYRDLEMFARLKQEGKYF